MLVLDDSPMMRDVVALVLGASPDVTIAAEAGTGEEALLALDRPGIDVITVDLELPDVDGRQLVSRLVASGRHGVVVLSGSCDRIGDVSWINQVAVFDKARLVDNRHRFIDAIKSAAGHSPQRQVGAMVEASRAFRRRAPAPRIRSAFAS